MGRAFPASQARGCASLDPRGDFPVRKPIMHVQCLLSRLNGSREANGRLSGNGSPSKKRYDASSKGRRKFVTPDTSAQGRQTPLRLSTKVSTSFPALSEGKRRNGKPRTSDKGAILHRIVGPYPPIGNGSGRQNSLGDRSQPRTKSRVCSRPIPNRERELNCKHL